MIDEHTLPSELTVGAVRRGNEYGWPISTFPSALEAAARLGYACIGGQFQFRLPDAICEMYWLAADPTERLPGEAWDDYRRRSLSEVSEKFHLLVRQVDFARMAQEWPTVKDRILAFPDLNTVVAFVAYFVTEDESSELLTRTIRASAGRPIPN